MPVQFLSVAERARLSRFPTEVPPEDLIAYFTLTSADLGQLPVTSAPQNRLGFALQLCALRYLGFFPDDLDEAPVAVVSYLADQVGAVPEDFHAYGDRGQTRTEHAQQVQAYLGLACEHLRSASKVRPGLTLLERLVASARKRAWKETSQLLSPLLTEERRKVLDYVLVVDSTRGRTPLAWLRQNAVRSSPRSITEALDKLRVLKQWRVETWNLEVLTPNRRKLLAQLGGKSTAQSLERMDEMRRYPILPAFLHQSFRDITDEAVDLFDRCLGDAYHHAERELNEYRLSIACSAFERVHLLHELGGIVLDPAIGNSQVRKHIYQHISPEDLRAAIEECTEITRPEEDSYLDLLAERYGYLRQFTPRFLDTLTFRSNRRDDPIIAAIGVLQTMNREGRRKFPAGTPLEFVQAQWLPYVVGEDGRINRAYYELCMLWELRSSLRAGDLWLETSRRYANPGTYLIPPDRWPSLRSEACKTLGAPAGGTERLAERQKELEELLARLDRSLPVHGDDVRIENSALVVSPLEGEERSASLVALGAEIDARLPLIELIWLYSRMYALRQHYGKSRAAAKAHCFARLVYSRPGQGIMARVRLAFLGPPNIELDGVPVHLDTRKAVALMAYLCVSGEQVSRDTLVTLLWSRYGRSGGHSALRRTLSTLRSALGRKLLGGERGAVSLAQSPDTWVDVSRFRELLAECERHAHGRQEICGECHPLLTEAAKLFRGEFLAGFTLKDSLDFDDWQFFTTEKFRLEATKVLDRLALCNAAAGDFVSAIACAHQRLSLDRLDESAHVMLMRLFAWEGNRAAARNAFEECRQLLEKELDSPLQESTERLAERIASGHPPDPPMFAASERSAAHRAPYAEEKLSAASAFSTVLVMRTPLPRPHATDLTAKYHGRLIEASETGSLVLFDDGRFLESNAELAIRAALEVQHWAVLGSQPFRSAVATGRLVKAVERSDGGQETRISGRAVPVARLLAERAAEGSLLADEHTYRLTRDAFSFARNAGLRGSKAGSRRCFRVLGVATVSRKSRGTGVRAEMIGREEETKKLDRAFRKTIEGTGQVVVVTGEAGIGKSRLVRELYNSAAGTLSAGEVRWLEGRCLSPNTNVGYWPFIDMIDVLRAEPAAHEPAASGADAAPSSPSLDELLAPASVGASAVSPRPEAAVGELAAATQELLEGSRAGPHGEEIQRLSPEQVKHRAFLAVSLLFRELAAAVPLVLVFEDLHWADTLSLELIDSLLDSLRALRVLLLLVYRIEPGHRSRNLAANAARLRLPDLTEVHLREISFQESSLMLDALVPVETIPAATREDILQKCRGNPYFLEELARAAASSPGSLELDEPPAEGGSQQEEPRRGLPEGIKAVVLSRFYNLSEIEQQVLSFGAVIGRVFLLRILALSMVRGDLGSILEDLEDRGLVFFERAVPDVEYSFKHVLAQEAIYDSLSAQARAELHRKVAHAYEQLSPTARQDYCEFLAYHFDRGGEARQAIDYYFISGEKARQGYANNSAVAYLTRGLELLRASFSDGPSSLDRELEFLVSLGVPLVLVRGHQDPTVEAVHLRAKAICEERGSSEQLFQVNLGLNRYYAYSRKRLLYGEQMLEIAHDLKDSRLISRAHAMLSESFFYFGDFPQMLAHAEAGQQHCQPAGSALDLIQFGNDTTVLVLIVRSFAVWALGFPRQAATVMEEALSRARALGHAFTLCMAIFFAGLLFFVLREQQKTRVLSEELSVLARREGFALYIAYGLVLGGWSSGDHRMIVQGSELLPRHPFPCPYACMLAELYLEERQTDLAIATLEKALALVRTTHLHLWESEVYRLRGEIGLAAGEPDVDVGSWFERSLRLSQKQRAKSLELRATMAMYRFGIKRGNGELRDQLDRLQGSFDEGSDSLDLREARQLLHARPD